MLGAVFSRDEYEYDIPQFDDRKQKHLQPSVVTFNIFLAFTYNPMYFYISTFSKHKQSLIKSTTHLSCPLPHSSSSAPHKQPVSQHPSYTYTSPAPQPSKSHLSPHKPTQP